MNSRRARTRAAPGPEAAALGAKRSKPDAFNRSIGAKGFGLLTERLSEAAREERQRAFIEEHEGDIIAALVHRAKKGDVAAARLALEYAHPPPGSRLTPFPSLLVNGPEDAVDMLEHALSAVSLGELSVAEAEQIFGLVQKYLAARAALPKIGPSRDPVKVAREQERLQKEREDAIKSLTEKFEAAERDSRRASPN